jgi:hypothetical protein
MAPVKKHTVLQMTKAVTWFLDFDEYRRNHTYKCQLEGCGGWLRELKGISTSSGKPYHFFL